MRSASLRAPEMKEEEDQPPSAGGEEDGAASSDGEGSAGMSSSRGEDGSGSGLEGVFTRYVRSLDPDGEPTPEDFADMWRGLRAVVTSELRQRGLWESPPTYLGITGWESWQARDPNPGRTGSALEELLTDCYTFVFLERLRPLQAQVAVKGNIDGFVRLYLRNYLHDRRKRQDLLGYWIFESLRGAVRLAVEAGELWVIQGSRKILNGTLLAMRPDEDPDRAAPASTLAALAGGWVGGLLPDLITAGGSRRRLVLQRLQARLADLEAAGAFVFRFRDLIDPFKREVRSRWAAILGEEDETGFEDDGEGGSRMVPLVEPDSDYEQRESYTRLVSCVANLIEGLEEPERLRQETRTLLGFLRVFATDRAQEQLPSGRRLAELLQIPRKRLPRLWEILRGLVRRCQEKLGSGSPLRFEGPSLFPGGRDES